jgi:filamentous hemagglutinin family protein
LPQVRVRPLAAAVAAALAVGSAAHAQTSQPALPAGTLPTLLPNGVQSGLDTTRPGGAFVWSALSAGLRLDIYQSASRATIDWSSFNIATGSLVRFNQHPGDAALNRIWDASPSLIQGSLQADGAVYLLNQNGIIFDRGSQVNVNTLVASTLALNVVSGKDFFNNGQTGIGSSPAFAGFMNGPDGKPSQIQLLGTVSTASGGAVLVFAPRILQEGTVVAPDGQIVLAAGERVWLGTNPTDTSMRGFVVEFRADSTTTLANALERSGIENRPAPGAAPGTTGVIQADRGNVTLAALAINQEGRVSASSAALLNGSVWLVSKEGGPVISGVIASSDRAGSVRLAPGSVTETPLDRSDTGTVAEDQLRDTNGKPVNPYPGQIKIQGQAIEIAGSVTSPGGNIRIGSDPSDAPGIATQHIYLDPGAQVSAAGEWVDLPLSKRLLTIQITSNELKDSPVQKGGILQGATVTVDTRKGTPLFDVAPFVNNIQRGVAEEAAVGGTVTLYSRGDVVARPGSLLDVSGGGYRYAAGTQYTTKLVSNGVVYDIASAPRDRRYDLLADSFEKKYARWGVTERWSLPQQYLVGTREAPDVEGKPAGTLVVNAIGGAILEGEARGQVTAGRYQLDADRFPKAGTLIVGAEPNNQFTQTAINLAVSGPVLPGTFAAFDPLPAGLNGATILPGGTFAGGSSEAQGQYTQRGFADVELFASDSILLPSSSRLELAPGGTLTLGANRLQIDGSVLAPGGNVNLIGFQTGGGGTPQIAVGATASIGARGYWINETPSGLQQSAAPGLLPRFISGGSIRVGPPVAVAGSSSIPVNVSLASGSVLDVSGGAKLYSATGSNGAATDTLSAGNAGSITISSGDGTGNGSSGTLAIDGTMRGYSLAQGGSLTISAGSVRLGGSATGAAGETWLPSALLASGGFGSYTISGVASLVVPKDADLEPRTAPLVLSSAGARLQPSGADLLSFAAVLPATPARPAPASLTLKTVADGANFVVEGDASGRARIAADVGGAITLDARDRLSVNGAIDAPAGSITLKLTSSLPLSAPTLTIGDQAYLSARGAFVPQLTANGQIKGDVRRAGSIAISASAAGVDIAQGAMLDVSGAAHDIDLPAGLGGGVQRTYVTGDAGTISITANYGVRLNGSLVGKAQGNSAGGALALDLRKIDPTNSTQNLSELPRRLVIAEDGAGLGTANGAFVEGFLAVGALADNGFDKLQLRTGDAVAFRGDVSLSLKRALAIDAPVFSADAGTHVELSAPQVSFGGTNPVLVQPGLQDGVSPAYGTPLPGTATLDVSAAGNGTGLIELFGYSRLDGFASASFTSAGDIRTAGVAAGSINTAIDSVRGWLHTNGTLKLSGAQLYPTTFSQFELKAFGPSSVLRVESNGAAPLPAYSAGATLSLSANVIEQFGVVKAPLGTINMTADDHVELGAGSLTSVSAAELAIPYGGTTSGQTLAYLGVPVNQPPVKSISLTSQDVFVRANAVVDVSGGGDIYGVEFLPGSGGSSDFLKDGNSNGQVYVVLPGLRGGVAPSDAYLASLKDLGFGKASNVYDSVYLSGAPGLPAGVYPLLSGYYAFVPGARIVQPVAKLQDLQPGVPAGLADGTLVTAGYRTAAGTSIRESRWSGFAVRQPTFTAPGTLPEAEYIVVDSSFLAGQAFASDKPRPVMPVDAGTLALQATRSLFLDGTLVAAAAEGGFGGEVTVAPSADIAIVGSRTQTNIPSGYVALEAGGLSALDARLVIGASRDGQTGELTVKSGKIEVLNSSLTVLSAPEIVLAATDSITIASGGAIKGAGSVPGGPGSLSVDGAGALLRVSAGPQVAFRRTGNVSGSVGDLSLASDALIAASGSMILDATHGTTLPASLSFARSSLGALDIGARHISLGEVSGVGGFAMSNEQLAALGALSELRLRSYETIDLVGQTIVGKAGDGSNAGAPVGLLTLSAAGLNGILAGGSNGATLSADRVRFERASAASPAGGATGTGKLTVDAREVAFVGGAADFTIAGFGEVDVAARESMIGSGTGRMAVAGSLSLSAQRITADTGSDLTLHANGTVNITASGTTVALAPAPAGGQLAIEGSSVTQGGRFELPSGTLTLTATAGDLTLGDGSAIVADGYKRTLAGIDLFGPAGTVILNATAGNVIVLPTATIDVSNPVAGDAGSIQVSAPQGMLSGTGSLRAAAAPGYGGGSFAADVGTAPDLSVLGQALSDNGFRHAVQLRARTGDIELAAGNTITAHEVKLTADSGDMTVAGTIDASGATGGGRIELSAGGVMTLAGTSVLNAAGTGAAGVVADGGLVRVESRSQAADVTLKFKGADAAAPGALIDVSGGAQGDGGRVEFYTTRTPSANASLAGTVKGTARSVNGVVVPSVIVYGNKIYTVAPNSNIDVTTGQSDVQAFMAADGAAAAYRDAIAPSSGTGTMTLAGNLAAGDVAVLPGVELQSTGNLTLAQNSNWDLTSSSWNISGQPSGGMLTIRAAGTLDVRASIGPKDPNPPTSSTALFAPESIPAAPTWSIQLVGGADTASADRLAVKRSAGDVMLTVLPTGNARSGEMVRVRTGTGDIEVSAGRDFRIQAKTASGADQTDATELWRATRAAIYTTGLDTSTDGRFLALGGDVRITALGNAGGINSEAISVYRQPFVNDWLRRSSASGFTTGAQWWAYRPLFAQSIGSFGGGDISVSAGGDIDRLSAMNASSGRVLPGSPKTLQQNGGGRLLVSAGGSIRGGQYLVSNNAGLVRAGGSIGDQTATTVYLIGESNSDAKRSASIELRAGGDIHLQGVANPTILPLPFIAQLPSRFDANYPVLGTTAGSLGISTSTDGFGTSIGGRAAFFSYGPKDSITLTSVSGNIDLNNTGSVVGTGGLPTWDDVAPPRFYATALSGNIFGGRLAPDVNNKLVPDQPSLLVQRLFPSDQQQARLYAGGNISNFAIEAEDTTAALPSWNKALAVQGDNSAPSGTSATSVPALGGQAAGTARSLTPSTGELAYDVVAGGSVSDLLLTFPRASRTQAGLDISNVQFSVQNLLDADVTTIRADRDIKYSSTYASGRGASGSAVTISGKGRLLVEAGRNLDLGVTTGIQAIGRQTNSALTDQMSSAITVIAGYKGDVSFAQLDTLFAELIAAGNANDAARGDRAVAAAFAQGAISSSGNVSMFRSKITTEGGSSIDVLVPSGAPGSAFGGNINAGLPGDAASDTGIITKFGGGIRVYTQNDFLVNSSKVLTQLGGDIVAYTSYGSIDAGRGARSSRTVGQVSIVTVDINQDGVIDPITERFFRPPVNAAGSGIRTLAFDPDGAGPQLPPKPGNIFLFAPRGTINAGEAGIASAGNVVVVALQVLNAQNITAQGDKTGVPVAQSGSLAASLSSATSGAAAATQAVAELAKTAQEQAPRPSFITARVLGFGDE